MSPADTKISRLIASTEGAGTISKEGSMVNPLMPTTTRVVLSMGSKGGTGKTTFIISLADWYDINKIPVILLDLDIENKQRGSLSHFYGDRAPKVNPHTPAGLDVFADTATEGFPVILADMGAGAARSTGIWFDQMHLSVAEAGVLFTVVGVINDDPASVEGILTWGAMLQGRVKYIIVKNALSEYSKFNYWENTREAKDFREAFNPAIINMAFRLPDFENAMRNHGVRISDIANRLTTVPELQKPSLVMRAQSYRRQMFGQFDLIKEFLL